MCFHALLIVFVLMMAVASAIGGTYKKQRPGDQKAYNNSKYGFGGMKRKQKQNDRASADGARPAPCPACCVQRHARAAGTSHRAGAAARRHVRLLGQEKRRASPRSGAEGQRAQEAAGQEQAELARHTRALRTVHTYPDPFHRAAPLRPHPYPTFHIADHCADSPSRLPIAAAVPARRPRPCSSAAR
jgi:hypothetical protein